jgi:glutamyl-Q tRNA(Asp) synthetase
MPVFRFAPSPNGYLHLGHALSALLNFDMAKAAGGRLLLRIEDIDAARCRPEYETAIYEDLAWLGLTWEEPVRRQSEHLDAYAAAIAKLQAQSLIFASFESRADIARLVGERETAASWPRDPDGAPLYPGNAKSLSAQERARRIAAGESYALRLDMEKAIARAASLAASFSVTSSLVGEVGERSEPEGASIDVAITTPIPIPPPQRGREENKGRSKNLTWAESGAGPRGETGLVAAAPLAWGDVVLARKETPTSYHLAVVVDDALQGITCVVRGQDLFWSTSLHRLLQALLGFPAPSYHHHRLILDADGRKLAKSTRATALRELRAAGASPADIRRMVGL